MISDKFEYSRHLFGGNCMDIQQRSYILITSDSQRAEGPFTTGPKFLMRRLVSLRQFSASFSIHNDKNCRYLQQTRQIMCLFHFTILGFGPDPGLPDEPPLELSSN